MSRKDVSGFDVAELRSGESTYRFPAGTGWQRFEEYCRGSEHDFEMNQLMGEYEQLMKTHTRGEILDQAWSKITCMKIPGVVKRPRVCGARTLFEVVPGVDIFDQAGSRIEVVTCPRPQLAHPGDMVMFELIADQHAPNAAARITSRLATKLDYEQQALKVGRSFWTVVQKRCAENRLPSEASMRVFCLTYGYTDVFGCRFELPCGQTTYDIVIGSGNKAFRNKSCRVELRADFGALSPLQQARIVIEQYQRATPDAPTIYRIAPEGGGTIDSRTLRERDVRAFFSDELS